MIPGWFGWEKVATVRYASYIDFTPNTHYTQ